MKKYRRRELVKFKHLSDDKVEPTPFPGKYPTRICWVVRFGDDTEVYYFGKPSANRVREFLARQSQPNTRAWAWREFDRTQLVGEIWGMAQYDRRGRRGADLLDTYTQRLLEYSYHPFTSVAGQWNHFLQPFLLKSVKMGDKTFRFYSPHQRLQVEKHINVYKTTLQKYYSMRGEKKSSKQSVAEQFQNMVFAQAAVPQQNLRWQIVDDVGHMRQVAPGDLLGHD